MQRRTCSGGPAMHVVAEGVRQRGSIMLLGIVCSKVMLRHAMQPLGSAIKGLLVSEDDGMMACIGWPAEQAQADTVTMEVAVASPCHALFAQVRIAMVGKYTDLADAYLSVMKALQHACLKANRKLEVHACPDSPAIPVTLPWDARPLLP